MDCLAWGKKQGAASGWKASGIILLLVGLCGALAAQVADAQPAPAKESAMTTATTHTLTNGLVEACQAKDRITSLRFDASGAGRYGAPLVADGGGLGPVRAARLEGSRLILTPVTGTEWRWTLPFVRAGFYDADCHLNYPDPQTTAGATSLTLPIRRMVLSAGQVCTIEYFKRLPLGFRSWINVAEGGQLLLGGDASQNYDLKLTCPRQQTLNYEVGEKCLTLIARTDGSPITIEVQARGAEEVPAKTVVHPAVRFSPDYQVTYEPTGKNVPASALMTDLLREGMYWFPDIPCGGDWGLDAVGTLCQHDPRSWYLRFLREKLSDSMTNIGYDRFEHFGLMYAWGRLPDYGAGALLNLPPGNALFDMRMIHLNGQYIQTIASYVLATGDVSFLTDRPARWLATDGPDPQPRCGGKAQSNDFILAAGDVRLDGKAPRKVHTLGQTFRAQAPFGKILIRLGNESGQEVAHGQVMVRPQAGGPLLYQEPFTLAPGFNDKLAITLPRPFEPGSYFVEIADQDSGKRYFGPGIFWLTDREANEADALAASGPFAGTNYDRLKVLFDYLLEQTGAARESLSFYQNNREYNGPEHKSGRHGNTSQNSFWESIGGGYDAFEGLWFNAACGAMAELAELMGEPREAVRYRDLRKKADAAYNKKYWSTVEENGRNFSRYIGCEDWDGKAHDYGFTYNNLEAAHRQITSPEQARAILWWLDRGQWRTDLDQPWRDHIYSIWEIAPPFNTTGNTTWLGPTGTLPYRHVLTNGGTRLVIAARDLAVRAWYLSVDNMHERNKQVLGRFASPDRLTGGRTFADPGGRGRWHFGEPNEDRADIEGFREIFQANGALSTHEVMAYLGLDYTAAGLWLRPRVPSDLDCLNFSGIGYWGEVFDFTVQAERTEVKAATQGSTTTLAQAFTAAGPFNKVGVQVSIKPFKIRHDAQLSLTLERRAGERWDVIGQDWLSHVQDGQWVWVTTEQWLPPEGEYRLRVHDLQAPAGETIILAQAHSGGPVVRLLAEKTRLCVKPVMNSQQHTYTLQLQRGSALTPAALDGVGVVMAPGERVLLTPHPAAGR